MAKADLIIDLRQHLSESINDLIKNGVNANDISDGYHTFGELYEHRIELYIALAKQIYDTNNWEHVPIWKSKRHSDGGGYEGWFILGINTLPGKQLTYHLPVSKWNECDFARELDKAPEFDGHTSADVLARLKEL